MSLVQCVLLDADRMPTAAEWSQAIRERGFRMDLDFRFRVTARLGGQSEAGRTPISR